MPVAQGAGPVDPVTEQMQMWSQLGLLKGPWSEAVGGMQVPEAGGLGQLIPDAPVMEPPKKAPVYNPLTAPMTAAEKQIHVTKCTKATPCPYCVRTKRVSKF